MHAQTSTSAGSPGCRTPPRKTCMLDSYTLIQCYTILYNLIESYTVITFTLKQWADVQTDPRLKFQLCQPWRGTATSLGLTPLWICPLPRWRSWIKLDEAFSTTGFCTGQSMKCCRSFQLGILTWTLQSLFFCWICCGNKSVWPCFSGKMAVTSQVAKQRMVS